MSLRTVSLSGQYAGTPVAQALPGGAEPGAFAGFFAGIEDSWPAGGKIGIATDGPHALANYRARGFVPYQIETYQQRLLKANALDFDDLIVKTVEVLQIFPEVLEHYQQRFRYIMVDEYQDTNRAQYHLVNLLSAGHGNVMVVGDHDQCLPPDTLVSTPGGQTPIEKILPGDVVLGVGGGDHVVGSHVVDVMQGRYVGAFVTARIGDTELRGTPHHLVPVRATPVPGTHVVYLMYRADRGYRIGRTKAVRTFRSGQQDAGYRVRMNQEHGDALWVLAVTDDLRLGIALDDLLAKYSWDTSDLYGSGGKTTSDRFPVRVRVGGAYRLLEGRAQVLAEYEARVTSFEYRTRRVVLIGDAVHTCPPTIAQGGAMALEDAGVPADRLVISGAAGIPTAYFEERFAAGTPVVRVMTNTPALAAVLESVRGSALPTALEAVLVLYRSPEFLTERLTTLRLLTRNSASMQAQAMRLHPLVQRAIGDAYELTPAPMASQPMRQPVMLKYLEKLFTTMASGANSSIERVGSP